MSLQTAEQLTSLAIAAMQGTTGRRYQLLWQSDASRTDSACLTVGLPRSVAATGRNDGLNRLIWWPSGVMERHRVAVVSSRIGTRHTRHRWWFDLMRTAALRVNTASECVVTVEGTAANSAVCRAADLFGIPRLALTVEESRVDRQGLTHWLADRLTADGSAVSNGEPGIQKAHVCPVLQSDEITENTQQTPMPPARDRVLCHAAERSYVLSCRAGGHIHRLLHSRLSSAAAGSLLVLMASGPGTTDECFDELVQLGAVPWLVDGLRNEGEAVHPSTTTLTTARTIKDGPLQCPQDWLCHWTRPCPGAWPDQPASEYLDELLLGCDTADRSALATLMRMVAQRLVLASVIRQQQRAVSFTEVPLGDFRQRRVYRRHRRRYDFEPWGIAVRRTALKELGAQPVRYGSTDPNTVDDDVDSVWYQPATDQSGRIDWREEREWRIAADLSLDQCPDSAVCLFVDTAEEAAVVQAQTTWPVIVLPSSADDNQ